ncbi:MAG: PilT/PilU family type 4a pilus ATPase [Phycisphaeraceae bacterium]|nr:PilT/PilU family type 4a pilus ATPase [Phycisphaeraceae bacterium]
MDDSLSQEYSSAPSPLDQPIYPMTDKRVLSVRDLLDYFNRQGPLRVSDLHLKVGAQPVYRVDGRLQRTKGQPLTPAHLEAMARAVLAEGDWQRLKADGAVDSSLHTAGMHFRLNCFHENDGLALAIRCLESAPPPVEQIGFPNQVWRDIVTLQQGLVLITGITGAGKSTTIASLINHIVAHRPCRIITLEDPIEYPLSSQSAIVSQREIGRDVPSFERGLRDALREDPDVIFVGEMRDRESTAWTLTAAETGHLVFSTLHTRDVRGSITRLLDMFPPDRQNEVASQLSLGLSHIIAQKLVPRSDGQGRVAVMEILHNTYASANLIRTLKLEQLYSVLQTKTNDVPTERMTTLERSLARRVAEGVIAAGEAEMWANDVTAFLGEMRMVQGRESKGA